MVGVVLVVRLHPTCLLSHMDNHHDNSMRVRCAVFSLSQGVYCTYAKRVRGPHSVVYA